MTVTADVKRNQARQRKRNERARKKQLGCEDIKVNLSASEREQLKQLCQLRAGPNKEPYTVDEYLSTLIRRDAERLAQQLTAVCQRCRSPVQSGCGGVHDGAADCFYFRGGRGLKL
jgi:hypothetical protein